VTQVPARCPNEILNSTPARCRFGTRENRAATMLRGGHGRIYRHVFVRIDTTRFFPRPRCSWWGWPRTERSRLCVAGVGAAWSQCIAVSDDLQNPPSTPTRGTPPGRICRLADSAAIGTGSTSWPAAVGGSGSAIFTPNLARRSEVEMKRFSNRHVQRKESRAEHAAGEKEAPLVEQSAGEGMPLLVHRARAAAHFSRNRRSVRLTKGRRAIVARRPPKTTGPRDGVRECEKVYAKKIRPMPAESGAAEARLDASTGVSRDRSSSCGRS